MTIPASRIDEKISATITIINVNASGDSRRSTPKVSKAAISTPRQIPM